MTFNEFELRDVFICHTTEDRKDYIDPVIDFFDCDGISYWLDEPDIGWGNSISRSIELGINKSKFVAVFISPAFFNKHWAEAELGAWLSKENTLGKTIVLPILIASAQEVFQKYPLLRDKRCLDWENGPGEIVKQLKQLLSDPEALKLTAPNSAGLQDARMVVEDIVEMAEKPIESEHSFSSGDDLELLDALLGYGGMIHALRNEPHPQKFALPILQNLARLLLLHLKLFETINNPSNALDYLLSLSTSEENNETANAIGALQRISSSLGRSFDVIDDARKIMHLCSQAEINNSDRVTLHDKLSGFYINCLHFFTAGETADERDVRQALAEGESERVEFKETMRWDTRQEKINKEMSKVVARTIAGFMNATGGKLLIGVDDDGNIIGLRRDFDTYSRSPEDSFQKTFFGMINTYLDGTAVPSYISGKYVEIEGKKVFLVRVTQGDRPTFLLDGNTVDYCLRIQASTKSLNVKEAINHYKIWWKDK